MSEKPKETKIIDFQKWVADKEKKEKRNYIVKYYKEENHQRNESKTNITNNRSW
jgi:hypothetical protein